MKEFPDIVLHKDELEELKHYSRVDSVPINARKPSPILIDEGMVSRVYGPFIKDPLAGGFRNVTGYKISDRGNRFIQWKEERRIEKRNHRIEFLIPLIISIITLIKSFIS